MLAGKTTHWRKRNPSKLIRVLHLVAVVVRDERSDDAGGNAGIGGVCSAGEDDRDLGPENYAGS